MGVAVADLKSEKRQNTKYLEIRNGFWIANLYFNPNYQALLSKF